MAKERDDARRDDGLLDETHFEELNLEDLELEAELGPDEPVSSGAAAVSSAESRDGGNGSPAGGGEAEGEAEDEAEDEIDFDALLEDLGGDEEETGMGASAPSGGGSTKGDGAPEPPRNSEVEEEIELLDEEDLLEEETSPTGSASGENPEQREDGGSALDLEAMLSEGEASETELSGTEGLSGLEGEEDEGAGDVDFDALLAEAGSEEESGSGAEAGLQAAESRGAEETSARRAEEPVESTESLEPAAEQSASPPAETLAQAAALGAAAGAGEGRSAEKESAEEETAKKKRGRFPSRKGAVGRARGRDRTRRGEGKGRRGEKKARSTRTATAKPKAAVGQIRFICSECYEEFYLPADFSAETITCPECLHVGKRPGDDFLRTVSLHKQGERKSLALTLVVGALLFAVLVVLVWVNTPYRGALEGLLASLGLSGVDLGSREVSYGLLGGGGLLTLILLWLLAKYESNRWEVYF